MTGTTRYQLTHNVENFVSWAGVTLAFAMSAAMLVLSVPPAWISLCAGAAGVPLFLGTLLYNSIRRKGGATLGGVVVAALWLIALIGIRFAAWPTNPAWGAALFFAFSFSALIYLMGEEGYPQQRERRDLLLPTSISLAGGAVGAAAATLASLTLNPEDALFIGAGLVLIATLLAISAPERSWRRFRHQGVILRRFGRQLLHRHSVIGIILCGSFTAVGLLAVMFSWASESYRGQFASSGTFVIFLGVVLICIFVAAVGLRFLTTRMAERSRATPAYLFSPCLFLTALIWWAIDPGLVAATALICGGLLGLYGAAVPLWRLTVMALPMRLRRPAEALIFGFSSAGGLVVFGAILFGLQRLPPISLYVVAAVIAACYLTIAFFARYSTREEWCAMLRRGQGLEPSHVGLPESPRELPMDEMIALVSSGDPLSEQIALSLATFSAAPTRYLPAIEPLLQRSASAPVRSWIRGYLATLPHCYQHALLEEADPNVRACVIAASMADDLVGEVELVQDPDPRVRALACIHGMLRGAAAAEVAWDAQPLPELDDEILIECLEVLPNQIPLTLIKRVKQLVWYPSPRVRLEAMCALDRVLTEAEDGASDLLEASLSGAQHESAAVRGVSASLLAKLAISNAPQHLVRLLEDPDDAVRDRAAEGLASLGEAGVDVVQPLLDAPDERTAIGALKVVAAAGRPGKAALSACLGRLEEILLGYAQLPRSFFAPESGPLAPALADFQHSVLHRVAAVLTARGYEEGALLISELETAQDEQLVILDTLKRRAPRILLRPLLAMAPLPESAERAFAEDPKVREGLEWLRSTKQRWLVAAADAFQNEESVVHRTLFLRKVPFFEGLTLDELLEVNQAFVEEEYLAGEVIFREGDVGDCFYLVFEGEARIVKGRGSESRELMVAGPGDHFGEMALFEGEVRSASAIAKTSCVLLSLEKAKFHSMMLRRPQILLHICSELSKRLRVTTHRTV